MSLPPFLTLLFASLILVQTGPAAPAHPNRPSFLLILADDLGMNDLGCYGSEIPTPQIDRLARGGLKFEQYYAASSVCTPSRFGLLTGRYCGRSHDKLLGALMFAEKRDQHRGIRPAEVTIAEVLRQSGYHTALIGKWHLGHGEPGFSPLKHGFDYFYGINGGCVDYYMLRYGNLPDWVRNDKPVEEKGYSTDLLADDAVRFLKSQRPSQPFFLFLAYNAPHYGKAWDEKQHRFNNMLQAKPEDRQALAAIPDPTRREYAAMVAAMDRGIGRVLDTLRTLNLEENTIVAFASDNGGDPNYGGSNKPFRGGKNEPFEGGIRVPCLIQWPGRIKAGSATTQSVCAIDFFPTFCRLAGVPITEFHVDGMDLTPVLLDRKPFGRDLCWTLGKATAFRRGPWKYVSAADTEMLFNLEADPCERTNLAEANPGCLSELRQAYGALATTFDAAKSKPNRHNTAKEQTDRNL